MKSIIISSDSSGGGKTTVTLALMKALKNRGYSVQGYKVGPDYIDPAFHREILGVSSKNLDLHLMGGDSVQAIYSKGESDFGVIEGVMGLYDGKGIDTRCSTYDISNTLGSLPIVLVLNPKGKSTTIAAEINGLLAFKNPNVVGVIFNSVSKSYYLLLKAIVEKYCKIKVFGFMPNEPRLALKSRHLGLVQSVEVEDILEKIDLSASLLEEHIDMELLITSFGEYKYKSVCNSILKRNKKLRIAVAFDKAFNFYYEDNIELLKEIGDIIYFSPLNDEAIPKNIDFLYMGGGYPEVFKEDLSRNKTMLKSIKEALSNGVYCYAECGALMYLSESIDGISMVDFLNGNCKMTDKLQNFGYATLNVLENNNININCHEFHKSVFETNEKTIFELSKTSFLGKEKKWQCGYKKNNTIATYAHISFLGNIEFLNYILPKDI